MNYCNSLLPETYIYGLKFNGEKELNKLESKMEAKLRNLPRSKFIDMVQINDHQFMFNV